MTPIQIALLIVALILATITIVQSRAQNLVAWGLALLALALLLGVFP